MKVKTLVTLYHDFDSDYADVESPKNDYPWYKLGEDYSLMRRGAILTVYTRKEYFEDDHEYDGIVLASNKYDMYLTLPSIEDIRENTQWYKIIEE